MIDRELKQNKTLDTRATISTSGPESMIASATRPWASTMACAMPRTNRK
jgi:hypothetical protein